MGVSTLRRAVFLDRDGVLNRAVVREGKPYPPASAGQMEIASDAPEALGRLKQAGFELLVVTNQPDVARGLQTREAVEEIHRVLQSCMPLDGFYTCWHDDGDACHCRKPKPGLIEQAAQERGIDTRRSFLVGDRWRDIGAGRAAGLACVLIDYGYAEALKSRPDVVVHSLTEATDWILRESAQQEVETLGGTLMQSATELKVKLFADGADKSTMLELYKKPYISGFTTNPTLMRKAGITDYEAFAQDVLKAIPDRSISFEVFADEFDEMERQARKISAWSDRVYVKIPVTNTRGESACELVRRLSQSGVKLNVTALLTLAQVRDVIAGLAGGAPSYISVFAGRIADTGRDPVPVMAEAVEMMKPYPEMELIWASPRELLNVFQADAIGCHIITATSDILARLALIGKDLDEYSLETVAMFYRDAQKSAFTL